MLIQLFSTFNVFIIILVIIMITIIIANVIAKKTKVTQDYNKYTQLQIFTDSNTNTLSIITKISEIYYGLINYSITTLSISIIIHNIIITIGSNEINKNRIVCVCECMCVGMCVCVCVCVGVCECMCV